MVSNLALHTASERLTRVLSALERAVDLRLEKEKSHEGLELQLQAAHEDRASMASQLEKQTDAIDELRLTNREVAERIDMAMEAIRSVLGTQRGER